MELNAFAKSKVQCDRIQKASSESCEGSESQVKKMAGVVGGKVARVGSNGHNLATWSCTNGAPRKPRLPGWAGFNATTHGAKGQASGRPA